MLRSRRRPITTRFVGTDRFQVIRPLGAGGMGEVYEVLDREHDLRVALKVLRCNDPRFLYRFKQEFRTVQPLQHPNLASLGQPRVELAMATGDAAPAVPVIDRCIDDLRSSHIDRLQIVRCIARWLQARVHLAAARTPDAIQQACRRARRTAARLRGERVGYAALWAALLTASERSVAGDRDGAIQALRAASALGVDDLRFYGTMARHRLAGMLGGTEGAALADGVAATGADLGIAQIAPLAAVFTPGFGDR